MTTRFVRLFAAGALVAASTVPLAGSASAHAAPFTVTAGASAVGTSLPITLTTSGSAPQFTWRDTATGVNVTCSSVTWRGALTTGTTTGRIGTIDGSRATFTDCIGPAGLGFAITGVGLWTLDASDASSGSSTVVVGNIRAHLVATAGPTCSWDFAAPSGSFQSSSTSTATPGSLAANYSNGTQDLGVTATNPGSLGLWNVHGSGASTYCVSPSLWKQGDRMSWSAVWTLTADAPTNNPVAIT